VEFSLVVNSFLNIYVFHRPLLAIYAYYQIFVTRQFQPHFDIIFGLLLAEIICRGLNVR
jgi:hypothetical protein